MTSIWVAEFGCVYLMAAIDSCTREIVDWHLETRCRARESIALVERAVGGDYFTRPDPNKQTRRLVAQLERLGHIVTLQEAAA